MRSFFFLIRKKQVTFYLLSCLLIVLWWYVISISLTPSNTCYQSCVPNSADPFVSPPLHLSLSSIKKDHIQSALQGNVASIRKLLLDWDIDAQVLQQMGYTNIKRLNKVEFLKTQLLIRQLETKEEETEECFMPVIDDIGQQFVPCSSDSFFLPQTYIAACFLLALDPQRIYALPQGFRSTTKLFSSDFLDTIPLDFNPYQTEKIWQQNLSIAFVANYSHPTQIENMKNLGLPLFFLSGQIQTVSDITTNIQRIGRVINRQKQAELISLFIHASLMAIDNRINLFIQTNPSEKLLKILYINYFYQYSTPHENSLIGTLLKRLQNPPFSFIFFPEAQNCPYAVPTDHEKILQCNPDCILVSTHCDQEKTEIINTSFPETKAQKNHQIFTLDASIQQAPTQHVVLAYLDIAQTLTKIQTY